MGMALLCWGELENGTLAGRFFVASDSALRAVNALLLGKFSVAHMA